MTSQNGPRSIPPGGMGRASDHQTAVRSGRVEFRHREALSFDLRREAAPDFVEEIYHQRYMTLGFSRLGAPRWYQHDEALAVRVRV